MELEVYQKSDFYEDYISSQKEYYERENADAYFAERLAEKDKEIAMLKEHICNGDVSRLTWIDDCLAKDKEITELKQKLESVQASMYCDVVDANMENRRLKRALWITKANRAHAEWAHWATIWFCDTNTILNINKSSVSQDPYRCTTKRNAAIWRNIWYDVERKCLKKAEEYK